MDSGGCGWKGVGMVATHCAVMWVICACIAACIVAC